MPDFITKLAQKFQKNYSSGVLSLLLFIAALVIAVIGVFVDNVWFKAIVLAYIILP